MGQRTIGLVRAGTDVFHSSAAMPMRTWAVPVFRAWPPPMSARHLLQSEVTTRLVSHHTVLSNTFFRTPPTISGVRGNTRVDYILCPRAVLPHITSCKVWRRAGDTLHFIQSNHRRDRRPVVLTIRARLAYEGAPCAQRHLWDQDEIFAAATREVNRAAFINDVETELHRHISDTTSPLDVCVIYDWQHGPMRKAAEHHFTSLTQKKGTRP